MTGTPTDRRAVSGEAIEAAVVRLRLEEGYRFNVDMGEALPSLAMDEPAPLGTGDAPNASRLLASSVGYCLGASLVHCLRKARVDVHGLRVDVEVVPTRNPEGRLRIGTLRVAIHPEVGDAVAGRLRRCLDLFEDFCVVTESVRSGIDVEVEVDATATTT